MKTSFLEKTLSKKLLLFLVLLVVISNVSASTFLRPDQDLNAGNYLPTPLWSKINEVTFDSIDIYSPIITTAQSYNVSLTQGIDTINKTGFHRIMSLAQNGRQISTATLNVEYRLFQKGYPTIYAGSCNVIVGAWQGCTILLTQPMKNQLQDYSNLTLMIKATADLALPRGILNITQQYVETPDQQASMAPAIRVRGNDKVQVHINTWAFLRWLRWF